jgi:hypothetical protein
MVLDMEYREQELPEHGPGGPLFSFSAILSCQQYQPPSPPAWACIRRGLLLHEVIGPRYHGMCHI